MNPFQEEGNDVSNELRSCLEKSTGQEDARSHATRIKQAKQFDVGWVLKKEEHDLDLEQLASPIKPRPILNGYSSIES